MSFFIIGTHLLGAHGSYQKHPGFGAAYTIAIFSAVKKIYLADTHPVAQSKGTGTTVSAPKSNVHGM